MSRTRAFVTARHVSSVESQRDQIAETDPLARLDLSRWRTVVRTAALPGDHVVCCDDLGQITVNGTAVNDASYINVSRGDPASRVDFDIVVPEDSLWVLGDNHNQSKDSRFNQDQPGHGFVPIENVVGRAFVITWRLDRFGLLDFQHEVFSSVPDP